MYLSRTLVVEGKEDASYLSNYISSEIVVVNGFELSKETISYLKNKKVILLLDPDNSGKEIRSKLNNILNDVVNIEVDINKCTRGPKSGIAECQIDEILTKLKKYSINEAQTTSSITIPLLYDLGLMNDKELRKAVCEKLNLGTCNSKQLYKRLCINNINYEQLCEIIKELKNGNK